jgi:hypothetical protein
MRSFAALFVLLYLSCAWAEDSPKTKPITPADAAKHINEKVTVVMEVKATKNRLAKRQEIYLDSETDFHDAKNLGIVITKAGAEKFKQAGIDDPAVHFKAKTIRVTGTVLRKENRLRIEVDDDQQIKIVEKD